MLRCLATFGKQFIDQRLARFYVLPSAPLCPLNAPLLGGDPQFVSLETQHNFISNLNAKRLAECRGNNDATVLVYTLPDFLIHVRLHSK
jgi:hypothetical protein